MSEAAPESTEIASGDISSWRFGRIEPTPLHVPSGWGLAPITSIAKLESGHTPSRHEPKYWRGSIPWVSLHDSKDLDVPEIHDTKLTVSQLGIANSSARILPKGTVVFSRTATIGKCTALGREMATSQDFANYICGPRLHNRYLVSLFRYMQHTWKSLMAGSTHNTIYMPFFKKLQILVPPLPEQRKIASILTTVDSLIEQTEALIEKYRRVKQGMMADLLSRGVDSDGKLRPTQQQAPELYKQSELGWIPNEWQSRQIAEVSRVRGGKRLPAGQEFADGETAFPYLRVSDMVNGSIDDSHIVYVKPEIEPLIRQYKIACTDLYVTIAGTLGQFGRIPTKFDGAQLTENALKLTEIDRTAVDVDFLCYFLQSECVQAQIRVAMGVGGGVPKLPLYQVERLRFICPNRLPEQQKIASILASVDQSVTREDASLAKLRTLKTGLMQDLLTGKVRVKVDEAEEVTADV